MSLTRDVERQIWKIEGFEIHVLHEDGRNLRGDRQGLPWYKYKVGAKNDMTVEAWKQTRFRPHYSGFDVKVVNASGEAVPGNTRLGTVRATYQEK